MVGMEAHGGGSRPLDGAAAPLPVLLPVIPVGSLGSGRGQNREEALVCFQAVLRRATFRQPCQEHEAVRFARWNPPVGYPKEKPTPHICQLCQPTSFYSPEFLQIFIEMH